MKVCERFVALVLFFFSFFFLVVFFCWNSAVGRWAKVPVAEPSSDGCGLIIALKVFRRRRVAKHKTDKETKRPRPTEPAIFHFFFFASVLSIDTIGVSFNVPSYWIGLESFWPSRFHRLLLLVLVRFG